ncbi:hypothetical protein L7F22_008719 [Adiantum nelumboides]|nr:hypothetical protein [Adiantum nelumboides]
MQKIPGTLTPSNSQTHDGLALQDAQGHRAHDGCGHRAHDGLALHEGRGADLDDNKATQIKHIHLAVLCNIDNIRRAICDRRAPQEGLQDIRRLLGSLLYTGQMDPNARLGGVQLMWVDLPTHCKVDAGFGGVPLWNVFMDGIIQSVFTIAAEFLLDDGALVVACRAEHLFKVISEAYDFQFRHIWTLFLRMPLHTYVMDCDFTDPVATLIVAMFVHDLDGPLPVPFYDRWAGDIAADIDGYEADPDMLREPLQESSWTLDTSGAAFRLGVEKSEFFARWLIGTFTTVDDAVLDFLTGYGDMAIECDRLHRHCISIEKDVVVFRSLLFPQQHLPEKSKAPLAITEAGEPEQPSESTNTGKRSLEEAGEESEAKRINRVKIELKDKAETFFEALVNEVLVAHIQDMDEEDDNDEVDDNEDQQRTSRHDCGLDDDDNQDDPPSGTDPSTRGATIEPSNPLGSQ